MTLSILQLVPSIIDQRGDAYVLGAETRYSDPNPKKFDCSELFDWACNRSGIPFPDGAANQWRYCQQQHTTISLDEAYRTFGALIFRVVPHGGGGGGDHVVMSMGHNMESFEAKGRAYGVNYFSLANRKWTGAARIPGIDYGTKTAPIVPPTVTRGGTRVDTLRDVNVAGALGRTEAVLLAVHNELVKAGVDFPLTDKPHDPVQPGDPEYAQRIIAAAAARIDTEGPALIAAIRATVAKNSR